jgi:hypothetical protein
VCFNKEEIKSMDEAVLMRDPQLTAREDNDAYNIYLKPKGKSGKKVKIIEKDEMESLSEANLMDVLENGRASTINEGSNVDLYAMESINLLHL